MFSKAVLSILSIFVVISLRRREVIALLYCVLIVMAVSVMRLLLTLPWAGLQCVIVAFPGDTLPFTFQMIC